MASKIVIGNLKSNLIAKDVDNYLNLIGDKIKSNNVIICPTSIYLPYFLRHTFQVGSQDAYFKEDNCTGEVTPRQLKSMGVTCSIIGHSERRRKLNEDDDVINKKVLATLNSGMGVILCIGETIEEKSMLKTDIVIKKQLFNALRGVTDIENLVIAYEPVWAIGTNTIPSNNDISKTAIYIKNLVKNFTGKDNVKVLYGGSINEKNISNLNKINEIDGFLVGGSSMDAKKFIDIIEVVVTQ